MVRIVAINGSYRDDGVTDQTVAAMVEYARQAGVEVETVCLRDYPIEFCLNCRECMQVPGDAPGTCVHQDQMQALVEKIERADAYILASPTNLGSVTAIFKRFMERLAVYAYWPWGMNYPKYRKASLPKKKAVLISSCAAPGFIGRWVYSTHRQLKLAAEAMGAEPVGSLFTGMIAKGPNPVLAESVRARAIDLISRLV